MKKSKKLYKNKSAAITHTENDLWQNLTKATAEKYNRVQCGKGSAPRNCFSAEYLNNYESIDWGH